MALMRRRTLSGNRRERAPGTAIPAREGGFTVFPFAIEASFVRARAVCFMGEGIG